MRCAFHSPYVDGALKPNCNENRAEGCCENRPGPALSPRPSCFLLNRAIAKGDVSSRRRLPSISNQGSDQKEDNAFIR